MKLSDSRGIKAAKWYTNEILRDDDINAIGVMQYQSLVDHYSVLLASRSKGIAYVIGGLKVDFSTTLTLSLKTGSVVSITGTYLESDEWGFLPSEEKLFVVSVPEDTLIGFTSGGSLDRIDTLQIRPVETPYNAKSRNFKDPVTGIVSSALVETRNEYGYEFMVLIGIESATPVAPAVTSGWVKIAEVKVLASATSIIAENIKDYTHSYLWTTDKGSTVSSELKKTSDERLIGYWNMDNIPEIPDDPVGVAYVQDAWTTVDEWDSITGTKGVSNGTYYNNDAISSHTTARFMSIDYSLFPLIKIRFKITSHALTSCTIGIELGTGGAYKLQTHVFKDTEWQTAVIDMSYGLVFGSLGTFTSISISFPDVVPAIGGDPIDIVFDYIYIGTGSYLPKSLIDNSGNLNHGTIYGATPVEGISGKALEFDGVNTYINLGDFPLPERAMTISFWIKSASVQAGLFTKYTGPGDASLILAIGNSTLGTISFLVTENGSSMVGLDSVSKVDNNLWNHVSVVFEPSIKMAIYINGVLDSIKTTSVPSGIFNSSSDLTISSLSSNYVGAIDEPRIYNRALSADEIYDLYVSKGSGVDCQIKSPTAFGNSIMVRDQYGRSSVEVPTLDKEISNKLYADSTAWYAQRVGFDGLIALAANATLTYAAEAMCSLGRTYVAVALNNGGTRSIVMYRRNAAGTWTALTPIITPPSPTIQIVSMTGWWISDTIIYIAIGRSNGSFSFMTTSIGGSTTQLGTITPGDAVPVYVDSKPVSGRIGSGHITMITGSNSIYFFMATTLIGKTSSTLALGAGYATARILRAWSETLIDIIIAVGTELTVKRIDLVANTVTELVEFPVGIDTPTATYPIMLVLTHSQILVKNDSWTHIMSFNYAKRRLFQIPFEDSTVSIPNDSKVTSCAMGGNRIARALSTTLSGSDFTTHVDNGDNIQGF